MTDDAPVITLDTLEAELGGIEAQQQEFAAMHQQAQQQVARCQVKLIELGGQRSLVARLIETARRSAEAPGAPSDTSAAD